MNDLANCKILAKVLNCRNTKSFQKEYAELVKPHLEVWLDDKPCILNLRRLDDNNEQTGGLNYRFETNRESFDVEVSFLDGLTYTDDGKDKSYRIIFFNPIFKDEYNERPGYFKKYCVMLKVHPDERYVELSDLNNYHPCFESRESKFGRIMMRGVIFYCQRYQKHMGVDYIELGDTAHHWCSENKYCRINLAYSRQLLGDYPYYWQFGFRPEQLVIDRLSRNIEHMRSLPIDHEISRGKDIVSYLSNKINETTLDQVIKTVRQYTKISNVFEVV